MRSLLALVLLSLGVLGCSAHGGTVRDRFAADFGCYGKVDVNRVAGTSYVAKGCGRSATYTCARDRNAYDAFNQVCVRESEVAERPTRGASRARKASKQKADVERGYDEQRKLHTVRGTFKTAPKVSVVLAGAPGAMLGEVMVSLSIPRHLITKECSSIEVLVNKVPTTAERSTVSSKYAINTVQGRVQFATFKPLAREYSTLGVRACGYEATFTENVMPDVKKFFVIYSQLATEAMQQAQPPADAGQGADGTSKEL
jgi:hypothetical protein